MKKIIGKRIYFQQLTEAHANKEYCQWLNDPEVNRYIATKKATLDSLKVYIKKNNENTSCLLLGIFFKENKKHIGNIKIEPIDSEKVTASMGVIIGDKNYWGQGMATEAVCLLVDHAFSKLKLQKIDLAVDLRNKPAIKVYQKAGFRVERMDKKNKAVFMVRDK